MNSRLIKEIRSSLNERAKKKGMEFKGAQLNEFPWIKADACLYLDGLKVDYDKKEDFGNRGYLQESIRRAVCYISARLRPRQMELGRRLRGVEY